MDGEYLRRFSGMLRDIGMAVLRNGYGFPDTVGRELVRGLYGNPYPKEK